MEIHKGIWGFYKNCKGKMEYKYGAWSLLALAGSLRPSEPITKLAMFLFGYPAIFVLRVISPP